GAGPPRLRVRLADRRLVRGGRRAAQGRLVVPAVAVVLAVDPAAVQGDRQVLPGAELIRVGLDARCLNREHVRGMGKYVTELVTRLPQHVPVRWELFADRPDLPFHTPKAGHVSVHVFDCRGYRFHAWEQWALPRKAAQLRVDVLHCPGTRVPWLQR